MYESRKATIPFLSRLNGYYYEEKKESYGPQFLEAYSEASNINNSIPQKEKDPRIELADRTVKYLKGIAENVLVEPDLEARLMGETLVLNRSLDPFFEDYIEINDLNEPFELRRNQGDGLMPTIEKGEVIKEFRTRDDDLDAGIDDYPFLENMDAYRDEEIGDVVFGEPFLTEVGIKARRFEGMITIYNGNEEVTYQMVRSYLRFKHHTNEQCNKIPLLLKVSEEDKKNGVSYPY
ncbi:hypothetical protein Tco_1459675 [Tanacetum coccineum]